MVRLSVALTLQQSGHAHPYMFEQADCVCSNFRCKYRLFNYKPGAKPTPKMKIYFQYILVAAF